MKRDLRPRDGATPPSADRAGRVARPAAAEGRRRPHAARVRGAAPIALTVLALALALAPAQAAAQQIAFESELPRTLVLIAEEGDGDVATRDFSAFLREAGFPLIDPALAETAAERNLVRAALEGDAGAATRLGRTLGAQALVVGRADWGTRSSPADPALVTGTAELDVRALRMDGEGGVVAAARARGRTLEATEQAARTGAIREAADEVLRGSSFVGEVMNDWSETPWSSAGYFDADPGSATAALGRTAGRDGPRLAILNTIVEPADDADGPAARGIGVVRRGDAADGVVNGVAVDGVVVGDVTAVDVEGTEARLETLDPTVARQLGLETGARRFVARTRLPVGRDTVRVVARGDDGRRAEALAAPRIDERWAVVIGVGEYATEGVPDLEYAAADARAVRDFLRSDAAGAFRDDHVLYLEDDEATARALRQALFVFLQQADWDDLVVIYFAGHGVPDPQRPENLYLLPADAELDALAATAFPMWDVKTALRRQIAAERVVVIADACHAAGAGAADTNPIGGSFAELFTPSRRLTLTAAATNELSFEDARWGGGHGAFTHHLLRALQGRGDADGDGIVTFAEAADFVAAEVSQATDGRQNPQRSGFGDVPLAVVPDADGAATP